VIFSYFGGFNIISYKFVVRQVLFYDLVHVLQISQENIFSTSSLDYIFETLRRKTAHAFSLLACESDDNRVLMCVANRSFDIFGLLDSFYYIF
jgi:hypothetical protein